MYTPNHFRMSESDEITNFIYAHSFGILVSTGDHQQLLATHLPFFYDAKQNVLFAHVAKANPQWRSLGGQTVMVIFSGAHAYISPSWYETSASVPTWNYEAVHVYGRCTILDKEEELSEVLEKTIRFYEPASDLPGQATEPFYRNLMKAIVGFQIDVTDIQGTAKLSQNKPTDVQQRIITNLRQVGDTAAKEMADLMQHRIINSTEQGD